MSIWNMCNYERRLSVLKTITANNETINANVFKFTGTVEILNQWAEIISVVACTNMTNVYSDIWDGTNAKNLTKPGANFSGLVAGSFFTKAELVTSEYLLHIASENRMYEIAGVKAVQPFIITAKAGVDNFIRFNFTTNTVLNITAKIFFEYKLLNGSTLQIV